MTCLAVLFFAYGGVRMVYSLNEREWYPGGASPRRGGRSGCDVEQSQQPVEEGQRYRQQCEPDREDEPGVHGAPQEPRRSLARNPDRPGVDELGPPRQRQRIGRHGKEGEPLVGREIAPVDPEKAAPRAHHDRFVLLLP